MPEVELEWGPVGAKVLAERCDVLVIVDVLSFTTSLTLAVARGATVWPHPWTDGGDELARQIGAVLARGRSTGAGPTLSPASLLDLDAGTRLVLPSPNGSAISHAAIQSSVPIVAGCLRNARPVAALLKNDYDRVGLVPAGERWSDGSLRPCYEDWVGAGAVAAGLRGLASPEAEAAALAYAALRPLEECRSGRELVQRGFAADVELAGAADVDSVGARAARRQVRRVVTTWMAHVDAAAGRPDRRGRGTAWPRGRRRDSQRTAGRWTRRSGRWLPRARWLTGLSGLVIERRDQFPQQAGERFSLPHS